MIKVGTFKSGAAIYEIAPAVRVGIQPDRRVYWATPGGWSWVLDPDNTHITRESYKVRTREFSYGDDEYYLI